MLVEFQKNTQRFGVKNATDRVSENEAVLKFENMHKIQSFFDDVMRERTNRIKIQAVAKKFGPVYCCRPISPKPMNGDQASIDGLISQIDSGKVYVVLRHDVLRACHKPTNNGDGDKDSLVDNQDFLVFVKAKMKQIKGICSRAIKADYHILEQVFHLDKRSEKKLVIVDPASVQTHTTGWKPYDDPFDLMALGAFKAVATYRLSKFIGMSDSIKFAALAGSQTEILSAEYFVAGKSIAVKPWYGSYSIRFNLKSLSFEIGWVKFKGCGEETRLMVELKRKDRLQFVNKPIYHHPEMMLPGFVPMEEYLANVRDNYVPPMHDVNIPVRLS